MQAARQAVGVETVLVSIRKAALGSSGPIAALTPAPAPAPERACLALAAHPLAEADLRLFPTLSLLPYSADWVNGLWIKVLSSLWWLPSLQLARAATARNALCYHVPEPGCTPTVAVQDRKRSDSLDPACDVMHLHGLIRQAIRLLKGIRLCLTDELFGVDAVSIIPGLKVCERCCLHQCFYHACHGFHA